MAFEYELHKETIKAAANLSAKQFYFVKLDSSGDAALITLITDVPFGVLQNKPDAAGEPAIIGRYGTSKVSADAALATIGTFVGPSGDGQADARVIGTDTTHYVAGVTREAAGAAGDIIACDIDCLVPHRAS